MKYLSELNAFDWWLETDHLSAPAQLLWYRLMALNNRCGWTEWFAVDNRRLMALIVSGSEKAAIRARNELAEKGLIEYRKGKKGSPGKYKMNSFYCQIDSVNDRISDSENAVQAAAINRYRDRLRKNNGCSNHGDVHAGDAQALEEYDGMTETDKQAVVSFAGYLLSHYFGREATPADVEKVCEQIHTPDGIDHRSKVQLERAFDIAADADERTWRYVYGILDNRQAERDRRCGNDGISNSIPGQGLGEKIRHERDIRGQALGAAEEGRGILAHAGT